MEPEKEVDYLLVGVLITVFFIIPPIGLIILTSLIGITLDEIVSFVIIIILVMTTLVAVKTNRKQGS
jgi:hypothetical protein